MRISREIGTYKKEHNMQILQAARYSEILEDRINQAIKFGIDGDCMQKILEAIHEESVRQQMEVMNE
jgi:chorismate mutase